MSTRDGSGLVSRATADGWAALVFALTLTALVVLSVSALPSAEPVTATTTKTTRQVVSTANHADQRTMTTETTMADVPLSTWERLLGGRIPLGLPLAFSLLGAFIAAAAAQRVLLGRYAFTVGGLSVPEITGEQVSAAAEDIPEAAQEAPSVEEAPEPVWATLDDPNLALAGYRIELEQELRRLAEEQDLPPGRRGAGQLLEL